MGERVVMPSYFRCCEHCACGVDRHTVPCDDRACAKGRSVAA